MASLEGLHLLVDLALEADLPPQDLEGNLNIQVNVKLLHSSPT